MHHLFLSPASFPDHTFLSCSSLHPLRRRFPTATVCSSQDLGRSRLTRTPAPQDQTPSTPHHHLTINSPHHIRVNSLSSSPTPHPPDQTPRVPSIPVLLRPPLSLSRLCLSSAMAEVEPLTSGASNRIIPILKALRSALLFVHTFVMSLLVLVLPRRRRRHSAEEQPAPARKRKSLWKMEEEDTMRRRSLAEGLDMGFDDAGLDFGSRWGTSLFFGVRHNGLFCRSWIPVSGELKGILIIIHGLNEHSGRYVHFARQLNSCNFGVYAMDWIGHGGSDGLHGYVPSLDHVVADTGAFLEKIKSENPGVPCFLFGHSTGGAVVLKAASQPHIEQMLEGIVLTSPALRVKPAHPIVGAVAPIFSLVIPKFQFKGANRRGIPVSRDPAALLAKYSDPLVYTGPIRVRTGHEILRITSYLMRNFKSVTVPFFVLHGTADTVTDPLASKDLYNEAASKFKDIKLYDGFLHDLLFEPEREEIAQDIIDWMEKRLCGSLENGNSLW